MCCACRPRRSRRSRSTRPWSAARSSTPARIAALLARAPPGAWRCSRRASLSAHELGTIRVVGASSRRTGPTRSTRSSTASTCRRGTTGATRIDPRFGTVGNLTPELRREGRRPDRARDQRRRDRVRRKAGVAGASSWCCPAAGVRDGRRRAELTLRFTGEIPGGAKTFTWKNARRARLLHADAPDRRRRERRRASGSRARRGASPFALSVDDRPDDARAGRRGRT